MSMQEKNVCSGRRSNPRRRDGCAAMTAGKVGGGCGEHMPRQAGRDKARPSDTPLSFPLLPHQLGSIVIVHSK